MPELKAKLFGTPAVSVDGREITLPYKRRTRSYIISY